MNKIKIFKLISLCFRCAKTRAQIATWHVD